MSQPAKENVRAQQAHLSAAAAPASLSPTPLREVTLDLWPHLLYLARHWRALSLIAGLAMLATWLYTSFAMTRQYRATAVLRPLDRAALGSEASAQLTALMGLEGRGSSDNSADAEEYIAILQSYEFTNALIGKHHLTAHLLARAGTEHLHLAQLSWHDRYRLYKLMSRRLGCDYSLKTRNLTITYDDLSVADAERILGYYIDDLRLKLSREQSDEARTAVTVLQGDASGVVDPLLLNQIEELIAAQIQRQELAQAEANFAFRVLEAPVAPDSPVRPRRAVDTVAAGLFALLAAGAMLLLRASIRQERP
jgi:LPS O-antigen subunit length determinant protein (WzzB/FepE family)